MTFHGAEDQRRAPAWVREIVTLLRINALFVLSGNTRDMYLSPRLEVQDLPEILRDALVSEGIEEVAVVRAAGENDSEPERIWADAVRWAHELPNTAAPVPEVPIASLGQVARILNETPRRALIVLDASRAVVRPGDLSDDESAMFREVRRAIDDQFDPGRGLNPLVWVVDAAHDVPAWFCGTNPRGRAISIPQPAAADRAQIASRLLGHRYRDEDPEAVEQALRALVDQTDSLPLTSALQVITLHNSRNRELGDLDDSVQLHKLGVLENPWKDPYLVNRLRSEVESGPSGTLRQRILGQEVAVAKSLDVLVRSVTGLRDAHASSRSAKPRGVLFFAGPTGVGKTELAKGLTTLLFGDKASMIRFDMSEFASPHAVERLVGAPPGYVGFSQGGELTNAVRQRPFSLLLFDEIEKADHQLLDRFLQILDDGRLTDGRGETTYFTESVLVFTSNLGVYETDTDSVTGRVIGHRLAVEPSAGYEQLARTVRDHVRGHFTQVVGRPELLNRIGDNVVVFDFIRAGVGREILKLMVRNVARVFEKESGGKLTLSTAAWAALEGHCLTEESLMMGGRGIGNLLETALIDPLSRWLFGVESVSPSNEVVDILATRHAFEVVMR